MEMAIRSGGQNAGLERLMYFLQVGYFSRRISDNFDWSAIEGDLERDHEGARGAAVWTRASWPGSATTSSCGSRRSSRMIRQHVERELERRAYRQGEAHRVRSSPRSRSSR